MMNTLTDSLHILRDAVGNPAFAILPYAQYQKLILGKTRPELGIPAAVVDKAIDNDYSAARAWREHLGLTQTDVARRMGVTQGAYAQLETKKTIRLSSRAKIAKAMGIHAAQLDF